CEIHVVVPIPLESECEAMGPEAAGVWARAARRRREREMTGVEDRRRSDDRTGEGRTAAENQRDRNVGSRRPRICGHESEQRIGRRWRWRRWRPGALDAERELSGLHGASRVRS